MPLSGDGASSRRKSPRSKSKTRSNGSGGSGASTASGKEKSHRSRRSKERDKSNSSVGNSGKATVERTETSSPNDHEVKEKKTKRKKKHWYSRKLKRVDSKYKDGSRDGKSSNSSSRSKGNGSKHSKSKDGAHRSKGGSDHGTHGGHGHSHDGKTMKLAVELFADCFRRKKGRKKRHHSSRDKHGNKGKKGSSRGDHHHGEESEHKGEKKRKKRKWWQRKKKSDKRRTSSKTHHGDDEGDGDGNRKGKRSKSERRGKSGSRSSLRRGGSGLSEAGSTSSLDSKKVKFNESVRVQEIPHKDAPTIAQKSFHARDHDRHVQNVVRDGNQPQMMQPSGGGSRDTQDIEEINGSNSEQELQADDSSLGAPDLDAEHDYPPGALGGCPMEDLSQDSAPSSTDTCKARSDACSVKSIKSVMLDDIASIFDPSKKYCRGELICMMEKLVSGINKRESLKARYDEEITRLSISHEYQADKLEQTRQKLDCLMKDQQSLDTAFKDSADKLSRNYLQLTRERKRMAGAVDLRDDFDKYLQEQISTKTKFVQDYAQILGKLEGLMDDSSLQWVQRETMISTESEALERLHRSAEKEQGNLQTELHKNEALYATRAAQNNKLEKVVEKELETYAKKQQEILQFNEKRIRALEGCIRTMQLDREVMYGEIAENRHRLKEVVEGRINALMDKVHQYKDIMKAIRDEIEGLLYNCKSDSVASFRVSPALLTYTKLIVALDLAEVESKVKDAKGCCDKAELAFKRKNSQKKDLTEIRRSYVEGQRHQMLNSEEEYFLMEPVEVPGIESNTNFQRSLDDFNKAAYKFGSGAATAPGSSLDPGPFKVEVTGASQDHRFSRAATEDYQSIGNPDDDRGMVVEDLDHMQLLLQSNKDEIKQGPSTNSRRRSVLQTLSVNPKNAAQSVSNAFKKISANMSIKKDRLGD